MNSFSTVIFGGVLLVILQINAFTKQLNNEVEVYFHYRWRLLSRVQTQKARVCKLIDQNKNSFCKTNLDLYKEGKWINFCDYKYQARYRLRLTLSCLSLSILASEFTVPKL